MAIFKTADLQIEQKGVVLITCDKCNSQYPSTLGSCPKCTPVVKKAK